MTAITFDTLTFANKLKNVGVDPIVAETQAQVTSEILSEITTNQIATKEDIRFIRDEMQKLEMRMYGFIVRCVSFTIIMLGGLQTLYHFV